MKLYSYDLSPFASAPRLAVYAKSLPVEIVTPPESGTRTPEYLAINPIGKVPALVLDDGKTVPESVTILEYLADVFPQSGLRPADPKAAAQVRLVARIAEIYAVIPAVSLFGHVNPATRNDAAVEAAFENLHKGLGHLDHFIASDGYAASSSLTMADCALVPALFVINLMGQMFAKGDLFAAYPKLAAYRARIEKDQAAAKVLGEMAEGLKVMQARMAAQPQPA